jgi:hypothetical protein
MTIKKDLSQSCHDLCDIEQPCDTQEDCWVGNKPNEKLCSQCGCMECIKSNCEPSKGGK